MSKEDKIKSDKDHKITDNSVDFENLQKNYEKLENIAARAQADLVNFRNRVQSEQSQIKLRSEQRIALKFIEIINQFEVAINSENIDKNDPWIEGITVIFKNFEQVLNSEGYVRIDTVGHPFDPRLHEAILNTPSEKFDTGTIISELIPGYIHNDVVVKPASVEIATSNKKNNDIS
ncbi:MAG: nucleotide exchange factor GrpE [Chloroflexi bacterium]|nr:nucleotide exchange factor GrpE [Chloroflexota bacterium]|tara:strand:+ start:37999 stop:38526 length:528 start_codon:yes stop_codon:yes gene_type:complete